jgi:hypothetical protein
MAVNTTNSKLIFSGICCVDSHIIIPHSDTQQDAYNKDNSTHLLWMTAASVQQNIRHIQTSHRAEAATPATNKDSGFHNILLTQSEVMVHIKLHSGNFISWTCRELTL